MRRFARCASVVCMTLAVILSGCTAGDSTVPYDYTNIGAAMVTWENDGCVYEARVDLCGEVPDDPSRNRAATVTFSSPSEIEGLTIRYSPAGGEASVGGVAFALSENMGRELYLIVRLFSLYPGELVGNESSGSTSLVRYTATVDGSPVEYKVSFVDGMMSSADISWDDGNIRVLSIIIC